MRKQKIKTTEFKKIFTKRVMNWRQKYMQTIWFVDMDSHYEIHQKVSILWLILSPLFYIAVTPLVFFFKGAFGVGAVWSEFVPYALGKPIRVDQCHHGAESTDALIKLAGWDSQ